MSYKTLDILSLKIQHAEERFYRNQCFFDYELSKMWEKHRSLVKDQGMTISLINLIEQRLELITRRWRDIYNYRIDYYLINSYDNSNSQSITTSEQDLKPISLSSNLILTTTHPLTMKQLQILNRGPTYVPLCQMYVLSSSKSTNEIIKDIYAPFKHQLTNLFAKYHINIALSMDIQKKCYDLFKDLFSTPLPVCLQQRAMYEKTLIHSIRSCLSTNDLILQRTADNMNTFLLANREDFERKAQYYLAKMDDDYKLLIGSTDDESNRIVQLQNEFKDMIDSMNTLFDSLKKHKSVDISTINKLRVDPTKVKLPYVDFLPDISQVRYTKNTALNILLFLIGSFYWISTIYCC